MAEIVGKHKAALERLIAIAFRDTGQSKKVADFLLGWWCAEECGGWDVTDLWAVDVEIKDDMVTVLAFIIEHPGIYPNDIGFKRHFHQIIRNWRRRLLSKEEQTILEIREGKSDASVISVFSTSEQCAIALALGQFDRLPEPYTSETTAWDRLNSEQRSTVARYNASFNIEQWLSRPLMY